jgi:hypothetical protein
MCDKCEEKVYFYNTNTLFFSSPAKVDFGDLVNGFTVKNAGNQILVFDDEELQPGESKAVGGNRGELFVGRKDLFFRTPAGFVGTAVFAAYVSIKFFVRMNPLSPGFIDKI